MIEGEELRQEQVGVRLQRPQAERSGCSEVRRDGLQGVLGRAVDVHVLKQEHGIVRCFWGK